MTPRTGWREEYCLGVQSLNPARSRAMQIHTETALSCISGTAV